MTVKLKSVERQAVVVFGASSGIGRLTALDFAARGAMVVAAARGEAGLQSLIVEIKRKGGEAFYVIADAADFEQVKHVAKECVRRYGRLDTWVHAAGTIIFARFEDTEPDEFKRLIEVNLLGQVYGAQAALPYLKRDGGALICVTSVEAYRCTPLHSAYGASKHGVSGFLKSLRVELEHENAPVSVTEIIPAGINTPIYQTGLNKTGHEVKAPLPPVYHPQVVSDAILYAAENPVRDMVTGSIGLGVLYSERVSPRLTDKITGLIAYNQLSDEPKRKDAPHNLYEPVTGAATIQGEPIGFQLDGDPYVWARTHPAATAAVLLAGGLLGGLALGLLRKRSAAV